ncbi:hypothetical protein [Clavibacter michiganensis]|uniref:Uncharacterized protein n=1 Tax=Clavibacter michiganensis subsp. insidiosus TaxID=33014 RepID=A0A0D5CHY7_9MICO|nr:hypothetical protein [Clavibacter michiganensis]AJW79258.1 hypothetical protein VO01_09095 [Clavibacter michiganensis subsp. insidiosus]AWF98016.1 hypothetical protein BEH61_05795 [Clavibacter michiganensis subsp. insidiosus]AWG01785.1 hypothetical protein BEH62_09285 [Clavibacter michiganensis subsp. insidiosus]OQJ59704.1 hypothetical protein B5P21_07125 [Clavibacter michiganensis subsp. insidiosus]RII87833.1 hypothetical protein DZF92_05410 [Clavibacter michiganensis subsp. insidiosus]
MDQLLSRLDRIAAGRQAGHVMAEDMRDHPCTTRAFRWIRWILIAETAVGATAVAIALTLASDGIAIAPAVWFRSFVVLAMTLTLYYFAWRASAGYWWAYSRLRLFSQIFPIVTLVIAAIPGLYPLWMVIEQIVFSLLLIGVADILRSDHMRDAFPKPGRVAAGGAPDPAAPGRPGGAPA